MRDYHVREYTPIINIATVVAVGAEMISSPGCFHIYAICPLNGAICPNEWV